MNNLSKWRLMLDQSTSPDLWIDLGWYFCVSSVLERRVWEGDPSGYTIYPPVYFLLVGPPGVGKDLVTSMVKTTLRANTKPSRVPGVPGEPLFYLGPDDTSYSKFIDRFSNSVRAAKMPNGDTYVYSSMSVVLSEFSSLFKRESMEVPKFLLNAYNCLDFEYDTHKHGTKRAMNPALNALIGTTPKFLQDCVKWGIFEDGLISRTFISFEFESRAERMFFEPFNDEQRNIGKELAKRLLKIHEHLGPITYTAPAKARMLEWFADHVEKKKRVSGYMANYWSRRPVNLRKLAMSVHFSDNDGYVIEQPAVEGAISLMQAIELNIEHGFAALGKNSDYGLLQDIEKFIRRVGSDGADKAMIYGHFLRDVPLEKLDSALMTLQVIGKIRLVQVHATKQPGYVAC